MRYRRLSPTGDYTFGRQQADFYINQPEAVAQAVATRLRLWKGQWFLDTSDGMDWLGSVLGNRTSRIRDITLQTRVLQTPGVTEIDAYNSNGDPNTRAFRAAMTLQTLYGPYAPAKTEFSVPSAVSHQPPAKPINVTVTSTSDTSVNVTWDIYSV